MRDVDYLVVGHVTRDVTPAGLVAGGTVTYAGRTAAALGCRTAAVTSAAGDYAAERELPGLKVKVVPAAATTTFENIYSSGGRRQVIQCLATSLRAEDVPVAWQRAAIVHLAPLANEVDPAMITAFSNSVVGLTPQGWMRRWDKSGRVRACEWVAAEVFMPLAAAVILSEEDVPELSIIEQYRQWAPLLVVTQGARGCTVYCQEESRRFPAPRVPEVELTGAGDVFAAAFLSRLYLTRGNPWDAAVFANRIASLSVTRMTLDAKIRAIRDWRSEIGDWYAESQSPISNL